MKAKISLLLFLASCVSDPPPRREASFPIQVAEVKSGAIPIFIETLGHVEPIQSVAIRSRIEGEITGIFFEEGCEVKKGDLLFAIDPRPYEADLRQAEGLLNQNLANLALAQEKVKRYKILARSDYYSQIDYETLQANMAATFALVEQNQAAVDSAKLNLQYCSILAPIDGMLGALNVKYGNLVAAPDGNTDPMIVLNQISPIYATFSIPEYLLPKIQRKGKALQVKASYDDFSKEEFIGNLFMIDNQVDPATGMIQMKAVFENGKKDLWPGQFVRIRLILEVMPHALLIPFTAVQMTLSDPIVYVVQKDHTVQERRVLLGERQGELVVVLKGLSPNEKVVLEGQVNLFNGAKIFVPAEKEFY